MSKLEGINNHQENQMVKMKDVLQVIEPEGILDGIKGNKLRRDVSDIVEKGVAIVLVDLQKVSFMDSSGLGSILLACKTVRSAGGKFYICSINDQIRILFELTKMDRVLTPFANREEFNKAILETE
jgi:anti-anti-sigma factor